MADIATVVSVAGENAYFKFASICIPSFLRNCTSTDLFVFTDKPERIKRIGNALTGKLHIVNLNDCISKYHNFLKKIKELSLPDEYFAKRTEKYGFLHHGFFASALFPIAQHYLEDKPYSHIMSIDIDGFFAGGDMIANVRHDIFSKYPNFDLYLIERKHELMEQYGGGVPGTGIVIWRKGGPFIKKYTENFTDDDQSTILYELRLKRRVKTYILKRPEYHFVRPFWQAQKKGKEFTKEQASKFLPGYFHFHGKIAYQSMKKMEEWFGRI